MNKKIAYGVLLLMLLAAPFAVYPILLMKLLCFALFACAFNLLLGYTGLLSFGHALFFGAAGYITGYIIEELHGSFELGLVAGVLVAGLIGLVMGVFAVRRQGIYFTMITLALAQMFYFGFLHASFTGGENGLNIGRGKLFGIFSLESDLSMYYLVLLLTVAGFALIMRMVHSPFGQVLKAIKENEPRAISLGYDVSKYKLLAFVLSAALAGLAGSLKVVALRATGLTDIDWVMSGAVVLMTLVGGLGTEFGPVIGAIIIILVEERLREFGQWLVHLTGIEQFRALEPSIVTGLIFVICVLSFRRGIVGELTAWINKRRQVKA